MSSTIRKVVIPAAGLGTRLRPATRSQPKEMLPVARKPTIQYVVEESVAAGLNSVLIITGARKRAIEDHFDRDVDDDDEGFDFGGADARFFFVRQSLQRGLADAVALAEQFVADAPFVVALGDTIIGGNGRPSLLQRLIAAHLATGAAATVAVEEVPLDSVRRYGIVQPQPGSHAPGAPIPLAGLIEKPDPEEAPSNLAIASRYAFAPVIFDAIRAIAPGKGGEYQLTDAIAWLLAQGHPVMAVPLTAEERRYDIGNFESYCKAFVEIALRDPELGAPLRRHLQELLK